MKELIERNLRLLDIHASLPIYEDGKYLEIEGILSIIFDIDKIVDNSAILHLCQHKDEIISALEELYPEEVRCAMLPNQFESLTYSMSRIISGIQGSLLKLVIRRFDDLEYLEELYCISWEISFAWNCYAAGDIPEIKKEIEYTLPGMYPPL